MKPKAHSFLHNIRVARPCKADWNKMTGDERMRFCHQCKLNVYNLSEMTTEEAEKLVGETEGRLCVRMYRRKDGTLITRDCPVGVAALRRRLVTVGGAITATVAGFLSWLFHTARPDGAIMGSAAVSHCTVTQGRLVATPIPPQTEGTFDVTMGDIPVGKPHTQGSDAAMDGQRSVEKQPFVDLSTGDAEWARASNPHRRFSR